ncbi:MAG: hypothetical protein CSB33_04060 [Desulfobacterales bacterium]|nr:MAG: hypothetical protein CSB33_04060 [Desulfobacterales bacterium]
MILNPIARELNAVIKNANPYLMEMLSKTGRRLFMPKGILAQSAEARERARPEFNATIGIATEEQDIMCLAAVMDNLGHAFTAKEVLPYAPPYGIPELRRAWRTAMTEKNPGLAGKAVSLPVVTNGITHGISVFADMFLDPDDVVLFPDKMWGNNKLIMSVRGDAVIRNYAMFNEAGGFHLDAFYECIRAEAENNYKVVVFLNFPNNPTGYTITEAEADRICGILQEIAENKTNVIAVMDDAYFGLRYEDAAIKESMFARLCDLHPRLLAVKLDGATKEMFVWGLRVGFVTYGVPLLRGRHEDLYGALEKKTAGNIRGTVSNVSRVSQAIVLNAMTSPDFARQRQEKLAVLRARAAAAKRGAADSRYADAWTVYPFNSGYFMCIRLKNLEAESLRRHLLDTYGVGLIASRKHDLRIAFSCVDEERIAPLFDLIYQGVTELKKAAG